MYKRTATRPKLRRRDRLFWVGLSRIWAGWRQALVIVTPATVLRWQRRRFRDHWTKLSRRPTVGRPPVNAEIRALVTRMAAANPLWGAPRIHGELLKLGLEVAERTVSRLMPKRRTPPSRFLARLRVLFILVVLAQLPIPGGLRSRPGGLGPLAATVASPRATEFSDWEGRPARVAGLAQLYGAIPARGHNRVV